jgi:hypothetical protein
VQYRGGGQTPVTDLQLAVDEVTRHAAKIAAYNDQQQRRQLAANADQLQALIQEQLDEREAMAQRIADHFGRPLPLGRDAYLIVDPRVREPGMIPGAGQDAIIIWTRMRGASPSALVAIEPLEENAPTEDWPASLAAQVNKVFGVPDTEPAMISSPSALDAIAGLIGHMFNELMLV